MHFQSQKTIPYCSAFPNYFCCQYTSSVATIGLNQSTYTVTEGAGSVSVMVDVQGSLARDVVVTLSTVDGTAMGRCAITC